MFSKLTKTKAIKTGLVTVIFVLIILGLSFNGEKKYTLSFSVPQLNELYLIIEKSTYRHDRVEEFKAFVTEQINLQDTTIKK